MSINQLDPYTVMVTWQQFVDFHKNTKSILSVVLHAFGSVFKFLTRFKTKFDNVAKDSPKWFTDLAGEKDTCTS